MELAMNPGFYIENFYFSLELLKRKKGWKDPEEVQTYVHKLVDDADVEERIQRMVKEDHEIDLLEYSYENEDYLIEEKQILDLLLILCLVFQMTIGKMQNISELCNEIFGGKNGIIDRLFARPNLS